MIGQQGELATIQKLMKIFHSKHQGQRLLLQLSIVLFRSLVSVRDAKAIGFSSPLGNICEITAPTP